MARIISFRTACRLSRKLRSQGKKIFYTAGCFDILHQGHIRFLRDAKKYGGKNSALFVGLETDGGVRKTKGEHRPIFDQKTRAESLSTISPLDCQNPICLNKVNAQNRQESFQSSFYSSRR